VFVYKFSYFCFVKRDIYIKQYVLVRATHTNLSSAKFNNTKNEVAPILSFRTKNSFEVIYFSRE